MNHHPSLRFLPRVLQLLPLLLLCNLGHANTYHFDTTLSGLNESPANASPGVGVADVYYDDVAQTMRVIVSFSDLTAGVTASHIHAATAVANTGTAGVATSTPTFTGFPSGVTSGSYDHIFDMTLNGSYNNAFRTANGGTAASASAALLAAMLSEKTYLNIHTTAFPGGEVRGFLHVSVPDSGSSLLLLTMGLGALVGIARRRAIRV